ncbi:MAG: hypothetical protein K1W24_01575 [Lachnospiraceae bacterium]
MNQYRRIVSYLYQYLNGEKGQNIGYVKLEQKGRQCRVTVQMRAFETSFMPEAWLFKQEKMAIEYVSMGRLMGHSGSLQLKTATNAEDVFSSGHTASDFDGAVIYINDNEYYATTWTNESIYIGNKINMLDKNTKDRANLNNNKNTEDNKAAGSKENTSTSYVSGNTSASGKEENIKSDIKNNTENNAITTAAGSSSTSNKATEDNTNSNNTNKDNASLIGSTENDSNKNNKDKEKKEIFSQNVEPDIKTQDIEEDKTLYGCNVCPYKSYNKKDEDFGMRILRNFPVMYPFKSGDIEESVRIEPKDIGCMPIRLWSFANNRFLLHGYYCYKHLIFAKLCNGHYALGVPGVYSEQESKRAAAFSFNKFQPLGPGKVIYGVFGYWITEISI